MSKETEMPERIYLQLYGDEDPSLHRGEPTPDISEATWWDERVWDWDIEYIRADIRDKEVEKLKAERDLLDDEGALETIGKMRDLIFKDYPESQSEMISFPSEVLKCALDQMQKLRSEVERLCGLLYGARCVYCGEVVGKETLNQDLADDVLRKHVEVCPKHPASQLRAELTKVKRESVSIEALLRYDAAHMDKRGWGPLDEDFVTLLCSRLTRTKPLSKEEG